MSSTNHNCADKNQQTDSSLIGYMGPQIIAHCASPALTEPLRNHDRHGPIRASPICSSSALWKQLITSKPQSLIYPHNCYWMSAVILCSHIFQDQFSVVFKTSFKSKLIKLLKRELILKCWKKNVMQTTISLTHVEDWVPITWSFTAVTGSINKLN